MSAVVRGLALATALLAASASAQVVQTYTEGQSGSNLRPLGYPVPIPVASLTPVEGFRDYASLHARLQSLALQSADIAATQVGQSFRGEPIWAYVIAAEGSVDREGRARPAFFINAATHAREWGVPEISTALVERFAAGAGDGGLVRYLLDNTRLVLVPVQNVDGFQQTQRYPTQVVVGRDPRSPADWPRDGRMRRKNMRGVDTELTTFGDHLLGVDLNRNHPPFWGTTTNGGQLTNVNDLTYRGTAPHSEPEVQAILAAAQLAPVSRIRLGIDMHSFSKVFFSSNTGRQRLNNIQARLLGVISAHHLDVPSAGGTPNGAFYTDVRDPPNVGIGTAAEYFAYQWLVPAWTLEIEPGQGGATEYGGTADSHGGFILPAREARRVREAWAESHLVGFYFMAGPPHLARVRLYDAATGVALLEQRWDYDPQTLRRELRTDVFFAQPLRAGARVRAELAFSKPMRHRVGGAVAPLPGQQTALSPQAWLSVGGQQTELDTSNGTWLGDAGWRYRDDSFAFEFDLPPTPGEFGLDVRATDMVGLQLDAFPATPVDWDNGAWAQWNTSSSESVVGDFGGTDTTRRFTSVAAGPVQAPRIDSQLPTHVGEGDVVKLRLVLEAPAEFPIAVIAEDPEVTRIRPVVTPPLPAVPIVRWLAGESGPRTLWLRAPEDDVAAGERNWDVVIGLAANGLTELARFSMQLLDNDRPGRPVVNARQIDYGVACCGVQDSLAGVLARFDQAGRRIDVVLHGELPFETPIVEGMPRTAEISGEVAVFGNAATIMLPAHAQGAPLLRVAAGALLELDGVALRAASPLPAGGAQARPTFVESAGRARLSRIDIAATRGGDSMFGGSGEIHVERSSIRDVGASTMSGSGALAIGNSSLVRNASIGPVIGSTTTAEAVRSSIIGNLAMTRRFGTSQPGSRLLLTGNLIQANVGHPTVDPPMPDCGVGITSGGHNIYSGSQCPELVGTGDLRQTNLGYPSLFQPLPDLGPWLAPRGAAIDYGGNCGPVDQRGAPRPQTLVPDAEPRCDVGAIELGVNPYRGIWQPARAGHGVDLQTAGNQLLLAWYTYDDDGQPTAYQAIAPLTGPRWRAELKRSRRDPSTGAILVPVRVGEVGIDFASDVEATLRWRFDARGIDGSETIRAFPFAPGEPAVEVTGLWFPPAESGWGATITRRGAVTALGVYYYDAAGALRWALGTGGGESVGQVQMTSYTGFCPDCDAAAMPVRTQPAGIALFHFLTPRRARIDTALQYPGSAGGAWTRTSIDFVPLNDPVDNREAVDAADLGAAAPAP